MTSERRLLNRERGAVKHPLKVSVDFLGWTGRDGDGGTGWICQGQCRSESEIGPAERDRCVARLITYLRFHYCKQCISLYVRSLLPFILSCLPACRRPSISSRRSSRSHTLESHSIARKALRSSESNAVSQMYFKTTHIYPSPVVSVCPPSCRILQLDPCRCPSCSNKYWSRMKFHGIRHVISDMTFRNAYRKHKFNN